MVARVGLCSRHADLGLRIRTRSAIPARAARSGADPDGRIGFGYTMNQRQHSVLIDPRALRLLDAMYKCL